MENIMEILYKIKYKLPYDQGIHDIYLNKMKKH